MINATKLMLFRRRKSVQDSLYDPEYLVIEMETDANNKITIPTYASYSGYDYNYDIAWGDGSENIGATTNLTKTYDSPGKYIIKIKGTFLGFYFRDKLYADKILDIKQWGNTVKFKTLNYSFQDCINLNITAIDIPDFANVVTAYWAFVRCSKLNCDMSKWNLPLAASFNSMFYSCHSLNSGIGNLNNVATNIGTMYFDCINLDNPLNLPDYSAVTDFRSFVKGTNLSPSNFSALLNKISSDTTQTGRSFDCGTLKYDANGVDAYNRLVNDLGWTITSGGLAS